MCEEDRHAMFEARLRRAMEAEARGVDVGRMLARARRTASAHVGRGCGGNDGGEREDAGVTDDDVTDGDGRR